MKLLIIMAMCLPAYWSNALFPPLTSADVSPGETITSANWEKVNGLVPEPVAQWVKKGDLVLHIDRLKYNIPEFFPPHTMTAFKTNLGTYEIDKNDGIVEVATGKAPDHIVGLPFPHIESGDPKTAQKLMYNNHYMQYQLGNIQLPAYGISIGRSGLQSEGAFDLIQIAMHGWPGSREIPNPDRIEKYMLIVVRTPFDIAGTAVLLWRFLAADRQDTTFGYVPAIRRARRMSPANRSDAFMGTDFCIDDTNGYDGKISAFAWKVLGRQEALVAFLGTDPEVLVRNEKGEWETTKEIREVIYGYEKDGWQGLPWIPTNLVWIKRPVYLVEMVPKDPYYNYGPQYMWVDAEIYNCAYKVIHDKSGQYWKTIFVSDRAFESADKKLRCMGIADQQAIDDRTNHSSVIEGATPRNKWIFFAHLDMNDFSLAGFQKYCK